MLHNKSIVVFINTASGNVAFIYQKYYVQVLINELNLNQDHINPKYKKLLKQEMKFYQIIHYF